MVIDTSLLSQIRSGNALPASARSSQSSAGIGSSPALLPPADDISGLSAPAELDAQVRRTAAAGSSVSNAMSFTQTQEGFLQNIGAALDRMSALSQSAQNPSTSPADRSAQNDEFSSLNSYIGRTSARDFNGVSLFSSTPLQVTSDPVGTTLRLPGLDLGAGASGATAGASIGTTSAASTAFASVQNALAQLASNRATVRGNQAALQQASDLISVTLANLGAVTSPITNTGDADAATESARRMFLSQPNAALAAHGGSPGQTALELLQ
jgi:flagellin